MANKQLTTMDLLTELDNRSKAREIAKKKAKPKKKPQAK